MVVVVVVVVLSSIWLRKVSVLVVPDTVVYVGNELAVSVVGLIVVSATVANVVLRLAKGSTVPLGAVVV